ERIDHDGVVDNEVHGAQGVDLLRVSTEVDHRLAHGGKVHDRRNAGEILHEDPRRTIRDLGGRPPVVQPGTELLRIVNGDRAAVLVADDVLEQDLEGERQPGNVADLLGRGIETEI